MNVPNRITLGRLVIAVLFFAGLGYYRLQTEFDWNPLGAAEAVVLNTALVLFLVAVLSDAVDGYFARKLGQVTKLGRIADPFVDKIAICGAFIFLAAMSRQLDDLVWPSMVVLIVGREFLVSSLRGMLEGQGEDFSAAFSGKAKMVVQSVAVSWVLFYRANLWPHDPVAGLLEGRPDWAHWVAAGLVWLAVLVTLASGIDYIVRARRVLASQL